VPLLSPLNPDERATMLVVSLPQKSLLKLAGSLGTVPSGKRLDTLAVWDLAWSLVDYYDEEDGEVAGAVDAALGRELGRTPLTDAVGVPGGAQAVTALLLESRDPARELAWALLSAGTEGSGEAAAAAVRTIIAEFDAADTRAREEEEARQASAPAPEDEAERLAREVEKQAQRARSERDRALKRVGGMKERLVELEKSLATARRDLRAAGEAQERLEGERDRLAKESEGLRAQLQSGTPAEVARLEQELAGAERRERSLRAEVEELRETEATLGTRLREAEERASRAPAGDGEPAERGPGGTTTSWSVPIFTDEFYESIRRWDRKVVRTAFEKIYRLAEDWRHPSLRAIPLEGLPDCYRIRVATDVRLIYRPVDGGRVEILSLIDREDLQRYIRQAKSR